MTFLNPFALIGLIAAGIPVLLHLLNLRKVRVVEFSTLSFLKELQPTTLRRLRIRQLLLLFFRTLLIILLVLAFSRPTLKGTASGELGARVKTTAVIAIDDSPSMDRHDRNGSFWSQATGASLGVLDLLRDGDDIVLLPFSAAASGPAARQLTSFRSIAQARSAFADLKPGTVSSSLNQVLHAAAGIFEESVNVQRELYLVSDFQEGLISSDPSPTEEVKELGGNGVRTYAMRIGEGSTRNLGITDTRVVNSILEQGKPFTVTVTLANSSPEDIDNSVVSVFLDGTRVTAKAVDVNAGTSPTFEIPVVAGAPGFVNGTVSLDDDEFPFDNTRSFSVNLRRELRVVLLGPSPSLRYLRAAIRTRSATGPTLRLEESTMDRLSGSLLQSADVLVLANTASISLSQVTTLKAFLEAGGGMLFFPGPLTDARSYQTLATVLGLPDFRGLRASTTPVQGGEGSPALFEEVDRRHPIFQQMFQPRVGDKPGRSAAGELESPRIGTHALFGPSPGSYIVVSLSEGSPFLIDRPVGAGRVMLFAVGAEPSWSDLPFKGLFVPLVLRSISYVAQEQTIMAQVVAGSSPPPLGRLQAHGPLTIHTPRGNTIAIPTLGSNGGTLPAEAMTEIGVYDITEGSSTVNRFVVNGAPTESLLRPSEFEEVDHAATRAGFGPAGLTWIEDPESLERVITEARLGAELWHFALIAALFVALLELLLARGPHSTAGRMQESKPQHSSSAEATLRHD